MPHAYGMLAANCVNSLNYFEDVFRLILTPFSATTDLAFQLSSSSYTFHAGCQLTSLYLHKPKQFYTSSLLTRQPHTGNVMLNKKYLLTIKEIRNIKHRYRPCYDGEDYDDYTLKVHGTKTWPESNSKNFLLRTPNNSNMQSSSLYWILIRIKMMLVESFDISKQFLYPSPIYVEKVLLYLYLIDSF